MVTKALREHGRGRLLRTGGTAAQVAGSQFAVATSYYVVLATAARHLDAGGFAAVSAYYLLVNAVGRGLFAAVELETTRAIAHAVATGADDRPARRVAWRHTGLLLVVALVLLGVSTPPLGRVIGSGVTTLGLLAVGGAALAASYLLRGPLAGTRRYGRYAATYWAEAGAALAGAGLLTLLGARATTAWITVFALAPLVATAIVFPRVRGWRGQGRGNRARGEAGGGRGGAAAVLWSAALLLAGQGLWNLAPVVLTARLADVPAIAGGFTTAAVILRAPVLFFPSLQALLLPRFTAMASGGDDSGVRRVTRALGALLLVGGAVWVAAAVFVVPLVAHLVFATSAPPPPAVLAVLAVSTVIGAAAQIGQTHLVAVRRTAVAASAWLVGLAVLLGVALLASSPVPAAAGGQLAGALVVLVVLSVARRRQR